MAWREDQDWERNWWGNCLNTYGEEEKQLVYAQKMGLKMGADGKTAYAFDLKGASVLDIGGGPVSLLLKCRNYGKAVIIDPCTYPEWVKARYRQANISWLKIKGEEATNYGSLFDEVWLYNCLQHTEDPEKVALNARKLGRIVRIFEWVNTDITQGHPSVLTQDMLDEWLGGIGKVEELSTWNLHGKSYYGIFKGDKFV